MNESHSGFFEFAIMVYNSVFNRNLRHTTFGFFFFFGSEAAQSLVSDHVYSLK